MWQRPQRAHACCPVTAHQGTSGPVASTRRCVPLGRLPAGQSLRTLGQLWGHPQDLPAASQLRDSAPTWLAVLALLALGSELLTLTSFLPPPQESGTVRQLSIDLFLKTLSSVRGRAKRKLRKEVFRSLAPLYLHLHDEEESVVEVGIAFLWGRRCCPRGAPQAARVSGAASAPAAASSLRRGFGGRGLCCCLGCGGISAVWQASQKAFLGAARFLRWRRLEHLAETAQLWQIGECMVRTFPQPRTGSGPPCADPALFPLQLAKRKKSAARDYLGQSLLYLRSPQEPLRREAVRFIGEPRD